MGASNYAKLTETENDMNGTTSAGLRLPVQAAVDRTATSATLADGAGVEASQNLVGRSVPVRAPVGTLSPLPPVIHGPCIQSDGGWLC
jgi:hypothetical protein